MQKVLFSTLGMTDPIKNDFDGPFLHILRHYKPCKAYLFMTRRVCELADQDDRYRKSIQQLCELEGFHCEIIELRYENIDNPQEFDIFYPIFEKTLIAIHQENPDCQILVNLSSGTPQMKSSNNLVALTLPFPVLPIQVTTPNERENYGLPDYDIQKSWESNIDNHSDMEPKNRSREIVSDNLRYLFFREAAISHIRSYDYNAALSILQMVKEFVPTDIMYLIEAARQRKNMVLDEAKQKSDLAGYRLFPIESRDARDIFEYLLLLGIQKETGNLMDFVRGISPALTRLFVAFLKEKCKCDVKLEYCEVDRRDPDHWILKRNKLEERAPELLNFYDATFRPQFRDSDLSCSALLPMLLYYCRPEGIFPNREAVSKAQSMRTVEEKIRNPAAHNIVAIREERFTNMAGVSSKTMLNDMQWMFKYSFPKYFSSGIDIWNSYNNMNQYIISRLKA